MSIYVTPLALCTQTTKWPWNKRCVLFAESRKELVGFIKKIRLKPKFIRKGLFNRRDLHYIELNQYKRKEAISEGVAEITYDDYQEAIQRLDICFRGIREQGVEIVEPAGKQSRKPTKKRKKIKTKG